MKKLSIILSLLSVVSLVMAGFGCTAGEPEEVVPEGPIPREEVSVDASYDGKEVEITTGIALIVTLESNATTVSQLLSSQCSLFQFFHRVASGSRRSN